MKKKIVGLILFSLIFLSMFNYASASVLSGPNEQVSGERYTHRIQAHNGTMLQFQNRTRIRINCSVDMDVDIDVDATDIGEQEFYLEIKSQEEFLQMNMTCRTEEAQLGIPSGKTIRNRSRNQYRINNSFVVEIHANGTVQARLGLVMSEEEAQQSEWAYFHEGDDEWVPVASYYQNGMLMADTDHFSIWGIITVSEAAPAAAPTIPLPSAAIIGFSIASVVALIMYSRRKSRIA